MTEALISFCQTIGIWYLLAGLIIFLVLPTVKVTAKPAAMPMWVAQALAPIILILCWPGLLYQIFKDM